MTIDCARFDQCNAPICPLDPDWHLRKHHKGEPVCYLLREIAKDMPIAPILGGIAAGKIERQVRETCPKILGRYGPIRLALERAAQSASKSHAFQRLRINDRTLRAHSLADKQRLRRRGPQRSRQHSSAISPLSSAPCSPT